MEEERIWNLFAKQLKEEISTEERRELHDLLKQNPEAGYPIQIISAFWKSAELENKKQQMKLLPGIFNT